MPLLTGTTSIIQALFRRQARALSRRPPDAIVCNTCNPVTVCRASTVASGLRATGSSNGDHRALLRRRPGPSCGGHRESSQRGTPGRTEVSWEGPPDAPKYPPRTASDPCRSSCDTRLCTVQHNAFSQRPVPNRTLCRTLQSDTRRHEDALCPTVPTVCLGSRYAL
jgi:hypothetical protein